MEEHPIILFDGVCNLCSGSVQFVIKRDPDQLFRFASLQSPFGQSVLEKFQLPVDNYRSFILLEHDKIYQRSTAALRVFSRIKGWKWSRVFFGVPRFLRDAVYNLIANNRFRWFGKKESCWLPTPELQSRFLS